MVALATAYLQNNKYALDSAALKDSREMKNYNEKLDSILAIKSRLERDMSEANSLLGTGTWLPDSIEVKKDAVNKTNIYIPAIDADLISRDTLNKVSAEGFINVEHSKWSYFFGSLWKHFPGYLITAFAISLGAPFWFDLLNRFMKLRTSVKHETDSSNTNPDNTVTPSATTVSIDDREKTN